MLFLTFETGIYYPNRGKSTLLNIMTFLDLMHKKCSGAMIIIDISSDVIFLSVRIYGKYDFPVFPTANVHTSILPHNYLEYKIQSVSVVSSALKASFLA